MIEKPKKERRFLKALGRVGEILIQEVLIKIGSNLIKKIGGKKTLPSILFLLASLSLFAQYPATGNKQRLGYQTTGDGLVFRGRASDTMTIKSSGLNNAYFILDTVNNVLFNYINTKGGWQFSNGDTIIINNNFTQPVDSLFFKTSVPTNNVDTAKMRWDSDLGTVVLGLYDKVPNELGFKNFWLVKNQTGSTITKGSIVYANGTVGASGRITVAKFIANGSIDAKYLLGITAHDLTDGEDGYVISFGKIRQVNTDTFLAGAILYPSPITAGVWTDVEPVAPNIDMPIGFCINSSSNNGTIAIRVASGYDLSELHDVSITSPVEKSSLYYSGGLWRDTTAALLVSDTASMLTPYFKDADTTSLNLTSRFAAKLNISDTASMLTNYLRTGVAASTYLSGSGTTNYIPKFTGSKILGNSLINDNGNYIGINKSTPTVGIDLINDISSTSAKLRLQTNFQNAIRTLELGSGDGLSWDLPGSTSQSPFIKVVGGDQTFGGGGLNFITNDISRLFIRQNGTVGIGTITPSATFEVHGSAVFNEGSTDSDFRVESDGNVNMLFVDASTDRVGIGTNAPDKTLHVNGEVKIATVTATPTALLGKDGSNVVGELGLGTGMSVGSGILSVQAAGASATGLVTSFGSQTFGGNKTFNGNVNISTGTLDVGSTGTFGGRVKTNWLERNYAYSTSSSFTVSVNTTWQDINTNVLTTLTLPNPATYPGKELHLRQTGTGNLQSASSNIIPFQTPPTGSTSTAILGASTHEAVTLVSDGTNWIIMQRSEN